MDERPPRWHVSGLNICDPNDHIGKKSDYITRLHEKALRRYLPTGTGTGTAVDLGCGYGRLTPVLSESGWRTVGIDPLENLVQYARLHYAGPNYLVGGLPALPLEDGSVNLLLIQNLLRPLLQLGQLHLIRGIGRILAPGGYVVVVDNLRIGHPAYISESQFAALFAEESCRLERRVAIRAARWWMIYAIRYGLVPTRYFDRIADWELDRMSERKGSPRFQYYNVLFLFKKKDDASG